MVGGAKTSQFLVNSWACLCICFVLFLLLLLLFLYKCFTNNSNNYNRDNNFLCFFERN